MQAARTVSHHEYYKVVTLPRAAHRRHATGAGWQAGERARRQGVASREAGVRFLYFSLETRPVKPLVEEEERCTQITGPEKRACPCAGTALKTMGDEIVRCVLDAAPRESKGIPRSCQRRAGAVLVRASVPGLFWYWRCSVTAPVHFLAWLASFTRLLPVLPVSRNVAAGLRRAAVVKTWEGRVPKWNRIRVSCSFQFLSCCNWTALSTVQEGGIRSIIIGNYFEMPGHFSCFQQKPMPWQRRFQKHVIWGNHE